MKKRKNILLPFVRGSSCGGRPYKSKSYQARLSRKTKSGYIEILNRVLSCLLYMGKIAAFCLIIVPAAIFVEDLANDFLKLEDFLLKDIQITGNYFVTDKNILEKAGINNGDNLLMIDLKETAKAVSELTVVKQVKITKQFPGKISISITERDPVFASGERKYLLDEEGIKLPFDHENYSVPEIFGFHYDRKGNVDGDQQESYQKTVEAIRRFYEIGKNIPFGIHSVGLKKKKYLIVTFQNEMQVKLPLSFQDKHFDRLVHVYKDLSRREVPFQSIDLTFRHVVVKKKTRKL